ncbi:Thyroid receptor-interacting protein 11 [Paragonimus westermani]|uniref:Thyroid receptor-interacting protein 11 n=1 Tax=Paragonimus westermani TaxID=34504 RepID=A0A8T0DUB0_9TREM|nr:Thyroid receptor-interacting protein 11 [Paragonimus westermani]
MDWLGGLSNIKGQITSITKDLLAESADEIPDPKTQLEKANERVAELESIVETQKAEIQSLKSRNAELQVHFESSQLRLDHATEQFEKELAEKEAIIRKLRADSTIERGEPEGQSTLSNKSRTADVDNLPESLYADCFAELASEDYHSVDNTARTGTATWPELRNEVAKLRTEVIKWRRLARQKKATCHPPSHDDSSAVSLELEKEIEDLKQRLLDLDEARQTELSALKDSNSEHINNLVEQLRDAKEEALSLRVQLEQSASQNAPPQQLPVSTIDHLPGTSVANVAVEEKSGRKKQRAGKKKKSKPLTSNEFESANTDVEKQLPICFSTKQFKDDSTQTDSVQPLTETSDDYEEVEFTRHKSSPFTPCQTNAQSQTMLEAETAAVQAEPETRTVEVQTSQSPVTQLHIEVCSVASRAISSSCSPTPSAPDAAESGTLQTALDDHRSQISDVSDVSSYSRQLDDLVHQLTEEMHMYEKVVNEVVSTVTNCLPSFPLDPAAAAEGKTLSISETVERRSESDEVTIAQQLSALQISLKARCERLAAIRKTRHQKSSKSRESDISLRSLPESLTSDVNPSHSHSPLDSRSQTPGRKQICDATESEVDGWQDDDFPEALSLSKTSSPKLSQNRVEAGGDNIKLQTIPRSESSETVACDLRSTVHELELRLHETKVAHEARVAELEAMLEPARQLQGTLQSAVTQLASRLPPPPVPSPRLGGCESEWPPVDPQAQLALLLSAEAAACAELRRVHLALATAQESLSVLANERDQARMLLNQSEEADRLGLELPEQTFVSEGENSTVNLAHQLCLALDSEYTEQTWDADQWDLLLYELLKPRFTIDPNAGGSESADERVAQLTEEVMALQDILNQHTAFRSQAERDLRQLLSTVTAQREQLQKLTIEKEKLETELAEVRPSVNSRQADSDDLSRTAIQKLSELVRSKEEELELLRRRCEDLKQIIRSAGEGLKGSEGESSGQISVDGDEEDLVTVLERLTENYFSAKTHAQRCETMYESAVTALQQKHAESQSYHAELQRVYANLVTSEERNQTLQEEASSLRQTLSELQVSKLVVKHQSSTTSEVDRQSGALTENSVISAASQKVDSCMESHAGCDETKLLAEIARLQAHLLEMEESYTTEALNAESREVTLRTQLREAETRLQQLDQLNQTAEDRMLHVHLERDQLRTQAEDYRNEIAALKSGLANLQSVLDSFQKNQQSAVSAETDHIRLELQRARQSEASVRNELERLNDQVKDREKLEENARQLTAQVQSHALQLSRIQAQVEQRDVLIENLRGRLAQMAVDTDSKIDKILMKNLLISYFQLPTSQRANGFRVIASLLQFTDEEFAKVGSEAGTIPRILNWFRNAVSNLPSGPPKDLTFSSTYPDKSFTELLLAFLENESGPHTPLRLSMDYYTPESVKRNVPHTNRQVTHNRLEVESTATPEFTYVEPKPPITDPFVCPTISSTDQKTTPDQLSQTPKNLLFIM